MTDDNKLILERLDNIKEELSYIKEHMTDIDVVLTDDDVDALREAEIDFAEGKTKRL